MQKKPPLHQREPVGPVFPSVTTIWQHWQIYLHRFLAHSDPKGWGQKHVNPVWGTAEILFVRFHHWNGLFLPPSSILYFLETSVMGSLYRVRVNRKLLSLSDFFNVTPCHHFEIVKLGIVQKANLIPLWRMDPHSCSGWEHLRRRTLHFLLKTKCL